jgi:hypothetical protein
MSTIILTLFVIFLTGVVVIIAAAVLPQVSVFFDHVRAAAVCIYNCIREA